MLPPLLVLSICRRGNDWTTHLSKVQAKQPRARRLASRPLILKLRGVWERYWREIGCFADIYIPRHFNNDPSPRWTFEARCGRSVSLLERRRHSRLTLPPLLRFPSAEVALLMA